MGIDHQNFVLIPETASEAVFVTFNDKYYKHKDGLGIGIKLAPAFAILYLYETVEKPVLESDYKSTF